MKKTTYQRLLVLAWAVLMVLPMALFTSCSESDEEVTEFDNWQERNDTYFNEVYSRAKGINSGEWRVFPKRSLNAEVATKAEDYIVVQVLGSGSGSDCPLYTDSVSVHYSGRLMPSASYPEGYEFDKSWIGSYQAAVSKPYSGRVYSFVDGFATALQHMHVGDHWKVYIPYQQGYGSSSGSIPAYSTLIFDLRLAGCYKP